MFENTSKFPRIFIYILIILSILIFAEIFFDFSHVGIFYFVAILIMAVFLLLDKKYGKLLTNHKAVFFLCDFINLVATVAILYYEYSKHNSVLNGFLIALISILGIMIIMDILVVADKFFLRKEFLFIDVFELCSMICIFTYFNKVSEFWFGVTAFVFILAVLVFKVVATIKLRFHNKRQIEEEKPVVTENEIEKLIQSNEEQGEVE